MTNKIMQYCPHKFQHRYQAKAIGKKIKIKVILYILKEIRLPTFIGQRLNEKGLNTLFNFKINDVFEEKYY